MPDIANALTVDVEDYFQVSALAPYIARADWDRIPCRVERNVERILKLLAKESARATFFILGWIAERHPQLVRHIAAAGHEVASHGYGHLRIHEQTPSEFSQDIRRAKSLLEDLVGAEVKGYRAPSFSIGPKTLWAFDEIAKAGYQYSSSVYPVRHDLYGMPGAPRFPYRARPDLIEIPVTTASVLETQLARGRWRVLPTPPIHGLPRTHPEGQHARSPPQRSSTFTPGKSMRHSLAFRRSA